MKTLFINFNGDIIPADSKVLTVTNRSFRYGDGVFESMRLLKGKLQFPELHAGRLQGGMKALKIEGYSQMDDWFLKDKASDLAARNKIKDGRLRLTVFRDSDGLYTPESNKAAFCLEIEPTATTGYELNARGLIMDIYTELHKPVNALSNFKTCNSLVYVMAGIYKSQNKLDDAFLLNQEGFLCESTSSNLFVWYKNQLYTPGLSEGCVSGVMRKVIMQLAGKLGIPVVEAQINPNILYEAEEVFLTNATRGVQWVLGFGVKRYFNKASKQLADELNKATFFTG